MRFFLFFVFATQLLAFQPVDELKINAYFVDNRIGDLITDNLPMSQTAAYWFPAADAIPYDMLPPECQRDSYGTFCTTNDNVVPAKINLLVDSPNWLNANNITDVMGTYLVNYALVLNGDSYVFGLYKEYPNKPYVIVSVDSESVVVQYPGYLELLYIDGVDYVSAQYGFITVDGKNHYCDQLAAISVRVSPPDPTPYPGSSKDWFLPTIVVVSAVFLVLITLTAYLYVREVRSDSTDIPLLEVKRKKQRDSFVTVGIVQRKL